MLQPFDYNAEEKNKHKFMVQTAFVPEGETSMDVIVGLNHFFTTINNRCHLFCHSGKTPQPVT